MARQISRTVVLKVLAPTRRHHPLVGTPGLDIIKAALFEQIGDVNFSTHEEQMIQRALELAWLDGAAIIASTTDDPTVMRRLPG